MRNHLALMMNYPQKQTGSARPWAQCVVALVSLGMNLVRAETAPADLDMLKKRFDQESQEALKPIALRYARDLEALRRAALQGGDARKALAIEDELSRLQAKTGVELPKSSLPGAVPIDPAFRVNESTWTESNGGQMTFHTDGSIITSWGIHGRWTYNPKARTLTLKMGNDPSQEWIFDGEFKSVKRKGTDSVWKRAE
jgi:hypothetical protein